MYWKQLGLQGLPCLETIEIRTQNLSNEWVCAQPAFLTSLVAQRLKRLPAVQETWVQSLGWEDPLEKEMAAHSSTLAWRIPWMEEPGGL